MWLTKYAAISFIVLPVLFIKPEVYAQENRGNGRRTVLPADQTINQDYFAAGDVVEINGTVNGDLYAAGGNVTVSGTVNGDVLVAGGNVSISGTVSQDVRVAGGDVTIAGSVGRNTTVTGGNVRVAGTSNLEGSLVAGAGSIYVGTPISGNVTVGAGELELDSAVDGNVDAAVQQINLTPRASINGDLTITSNREIPVNEDQVNGVIRSNIVKGPSTQPMWEALRDIFTIIVLISRLAWFLTALVLGLILLNLLPGYFENMVDNLQHRTGYVIVLGLLIVLLTPPILFFIFLTVLGIPLALILLALYTILLYLAPLPVVYWLGSALSKRTNITNQRTGYLVVGLIVYTIILLVPVFSSLALFIFTILGVGMIISGVRIIRPASAVA